MRRKPFYVTLALVVAFCAAVGIDVAADGVGPSPRVASAKASSSTTLRGIHRIKHVIVIMQENRSFDSYFGTYPGADGIPMKDGVPTVCLSTESARRCIAPFHDRHDMNAGGPHSLQNALVDVAHGEMNGFVRQQEHGLRDCVQTFNPACTEGSRLDVMGYHNGRDIPNYWAYARNFVLQDHMFEPDATWSLPAHLFMVSGVVGALHEARRPDELRQRGRQAGVAAGLPPPAAKAQPDARLRLDRPHVPPAQTRRQLGVLRVQGRAARLRRRRGHRARRCSSARALRGSGTRCPTSTP